MAKTRGLSSRDIQLLLGFAIFAEAILGYFVLIDPLLGKINRKQQEAVNQARTLQEIQALVLVPHTPVASGPPIFEEAAGRGPILLQQRLSDWVSQDGNEVSSLVVSPTGEKGLYQCKSAFSGSYETLSRFFNRLEHPPYLMGLKALSVRAVPGSEGLEAELEISLPISER